MIHQPSSITNEYPPSCLDTVQQKNGSGAEEDVSQPGGNEWGQGAGSSQRHPEGKDKPVGKSDEQSDPDTLGDASAAFGP